MPRLIQDTKPLMLTVASRELFSAPDPATYQVDFPRKRSSLVRSSLTVLYRPAIRRRSATVSKGPSAVVSKGPSAATLSSGALMPQPPLPRAGAVPTPPPTSAEDSLSSPLEMPDPGDVAARGDAECVIALSASLYVCTAEGPRSRPQCGWCYRCNISTYLTA